MLPRMPVNVHKVLYLFSPWHGRNNLPHIKAASRNLVLWKQCFSKASASSFAAVQFPSKGRDQIKTLFECLILQNLQQLSSFENSTFLPSVQDLPVGQKSIKQGIHDPQTSRIEKGLLLKNQEQNKTEVIQNQRYFNEEQQFKLLAHDRPGYRSLYQTSFVSHHLNRKAPPTEVISFKQYPFLYTFDNLGFCISNEQELGQKVTLHGLLQLKKLTRMSKMPELRN